METKVFTQNGDGYDCQIAKNVWQKPNAMIFTNNPDMTKEQIAEVTGTDSRDIKDIKLSHTYNISDIQVGSVYEYSTYKITIK